MQTEQELDLIIFGGTGDLAMRKLLPALYHLHRDGLLKTGEFASALGLTRGSSAQGGRIQNAASVNPVAGVRIIGVARDELDPDGYRTQVRAQAPRFLGADYSSAVWDEFAARLDYARVDALQPDSYAALAATLEARPHGERVFYLSTAPNLFTAIAARLDEAGLITENSRVVLEKPLGHDLASARRINDEVGAYFREDQIYRIDHYLGKEPVQNLLALRFGNALFEPLWRREWVRDVQITVAEQVGVETRGDFYERTGALRDMVQNHLLQLLCIVAMEPPVSIDPDAVRDEKLKILRALRPITRAEVGTKTVRGQYRAGAIGGQPVVGYVDEPGIEPASHTETFVALKAEIDTWRWAGVPFFLRTGKRMQEKVAEIVINFRAVPHAIFGRPAASVINNRMVIRMQPEETVDLHLLAKQPGDEMRLQPVRLDLDFAETFRSRRLEAYERLLMDVMRGNLTLFVRRDEQEAAWRWVEPILASWQGMPDQPKPYTAGTWGPAASSALLSRDGLSWHEEL